MGKKRLRCARILESNKVRKQQENSKGYTMLRDFSMVFLAITATAAILLAWDKDFGVPLLQLVLIVSGVFMGHIITEVLNRENDE